MSNIPNELFYTDTHEWIKLGDDGVCTLGVTEHAVSSLGDLVFIKLPSVGAKIIAKGDCGVIESVKSASDFYLPVAGEITEVNSDISNAPKVISEDPYGKGWLVKFKPDNVDDVKGLLKADDYAKIAH
ncbi:MAG: glycine cleavage system protein GcvH [Gammaproteobacteria bacterium]|nr:glycine cleavage system protein GcvH [Gammaproteobacteria bacterium]